MAFVTKTWKDRLVEFSGRRKLKNVSTNEEIIYDVSRSEGTIMQVGDQFSAENMNNLEQRIKTEFDSVNSSLESNNEHFYYDVQNGVRGFNTDPARGADTFHPFDSGKAYKITVVAIGGAWNPAGWISPKVETTTVITIHKDGTHSYTGGGRALSSVTIDTNVANQKGAVQIKSVTVEEIEE